MRRHSLAGGLATLAAAAGLVVGQVTASASTYATGSVGYDISYPQCGTALPSGGFGIVGVNAGYPFTYYNNCFPSEWAHAASSGSPSIYINTGYDPSYTNTIDGRHTTQDCLAKSAGVVGTSGQRRAWAVGCSEAERSIGWASCENPGTPGACSATIAPAAWWLDVETANSWCGRPGTKCKDLTLNQYTLQGVIDALHDPSKNPSAAPVGIYSTPYAWGAIVGGNLINGIDADWQATGSTSAAQAKAFCSRSGFTGSAPVWLVQFLPGGYDADYAC